MKMTIMGLLGSFIVATAATASVDPSPKPRGVYRLKPGIYVQKGVSCESAPNASIRQYDGRGISNAHTHSCRVQFLSRRGHTFQISQSCIDAGTGPAARISERQTITVPDALTFTLRTRGNSTAYRYCPSYMLPASLREIAK